MAGDEPIKQLTATTRIYNIKEAIKEAKRQQSSPIQKQSSWYNVKTGSRVYFTNINH